MLFILIPFNAHSISGHGSDTTLTVIGKGLPRGMVISSPTKRSSLMLGFVEVSGWIIRTVGKKNIADKHVNCENRNH